ncbi:Chromatin structure-remodeling complex protein like [Actinidia chinensis var. chinensis]|uniref:Chromatin structure-remodeling complex protein like n=1 Tax=Actinidia chinensis var. chinensis TaxID=1590841 RepID=A0A2R6P859_ACTCC|nr:Chromatin structure-remodeling complex protein like [Actinidia chinensis var. chinensis]
MAAPHNVELEAAKFLQKLIQESTDEPRKLAAKLYVILQHMRSSGKENSMPYQVISRAMETVINQHGLDVEALNSSRLPLTDGTHMGDSSSIQFAGSSQAAALARDSKPGIAENEVANSHALSRPPVGPSNAAHYIYQGSVSHPTSKSLDHESPSSYDTRSANSLSQERHDAASEKAKQNGSKKTGGKRKRADLLSTSEAHIENSKQINTSNLNARKGKLGNKVEAPGSLSVKGNEHSQFNMVQSCGQLERILSLPNSLRSTNITNSVPQAANSKCPDEIEVSSAHSALGLQQGGPRLSTQEILSSRGGLWHQNRIGSSLEISPVPSLPSDAGSGNSTAEMLMHQPTAPLGSGASGKVHGAAPGASGSHPPAEPGIPSTMHFGSASYDSHVLVSKMNKERNREAFSASHSVELSAAKPTLDPDYWKHGFTKGAVTNTSERTGEAQFYLANCGELVSSTLSTGKAFEHEGGASNVLANANKIVQSGIPANNAEMNILKGVAPRDTGRKSPISQSAGVPYMPFKEQHLKQLRAQCLVFLSFRNGMMPKKLHLEIALGNFLPKEDGPSKELIDNKGKELSINDPSNILEDSMPLGRLNNVRETEIVPQAPSSTGNRAEANFLKESEDPNMIQEIAESQAFLTKGPQPNSLRGGLTVSNHKDDLENGQQAGIANQASSVMGISKQMKPDTISWTGTGSHNESAKGSLPGYMVPHESLPERKDSAPSPSQLLPEYNIQRSRRADSHLTAFPSRELWKPISGVEAEHQTAMLVKDGNVLTKNMSEGSNYLSEDGQKNSEIQRRCIPDGIKTVLVDDIQKKGSPTVVETDREEQDMSLDSDLPPAPKYSTSEKWIMEQQKRRLLTERNWVLKHQKTERRIGTCSDKLKEAVSSSEDISAKTKSVIELKKLQLLELQRRLRSDILNDFFKPIATEMDHLKSTKKNRIGRRSKQIEKFEQKMKEERQKRIRERQKEFFSEIEVHKERLDDVFKMKRERWKGFNKYVREFHKRKERIHREKIDRIQREKINLLKINDVEGYLRMVKDAKSDRVMQLLKETEKYLQKLGSKLKEAKTMAGHFKADIGENQAASVFENSEIDVENEDDADQAMASYSDIKESIMEQPPCLVGGKLREYQMNGLRWLVSLYNNHLNGILADEMGLGKTVQVISLICYLMESKNDRGPFLVVVPSSVLPGERILQQKFNVLLTTYEYLMNKHDRPKLSKLHWHYIIIDEGHRIKNASCKLNADLKHYHSSHRLLLTGTPLQNNLEELWALLNFLLPNIFNSSEDFSEWFNKPFESNGDNSPDEALLSEEENLLIINRLHQVLRPFVLRRLKHKVVNIIIMLIMLIIRYQMNGLRWLLSLYNNHLNGILADEMGLGKTVQVISLICYLMETKNDRGPFLVVVPSSVLPGWESEINFWAPSINKIVYSGPPEERRRLFKERILQQKFNVLLTTYEYLMNKHDRPKLSKLHWHYIIIDEGHRIKNASCKLNADLKHYHSSHRLLLTGTPLQNNLEELWALLNFLLPNIFNSSEDFSQWFNKPFESNGDNSPDEALLSEEENLLIINRLHQVLRPFVLRRLKHKVENQLPEKIERLVRCEASAYQKLLMKRVEDNLGAIGTSKGRSVHNSVIELRNICNHPYLSQLHAEQVHDFVPKHYLPNMVRLCGKLEMLDRLLPKLKATDHRVLFFSTMTRLLDVMEDYLCWKQYRYLRLDGHTSGGDRGALIEQFNQSGSPFFIFLLSIRAGGVGVNLQAADTVIIFDTDWNPQVDLQAQARAHRIGQKKDVLVLRLETVQTVEEQVRAAAEHKLGVANQSITAGFFDNNTSAEDRREYLESLLRECKKEEAAPVLDDDALNDLIARSESEIDIFEAVDRQRREEETTIWKHLVLGQGKEISESVPPLPSRLITNDDLNSFYEAIKIYEVSNPRVASNIGAKRKGQSLGCLDTQHYGRGKRAREVRSYEERWSEEEFEKMCQADSPESPRTKEEVIEKSSPVVASGSITFAPKIEPPAPAPTVSPQPPTEPPIQQIKEVTITPPSKRGRGRPKRAMTGISPPPVVLPASSGPIKTEMASQNVTASSFPPPPGFDSSPSSGTVKSVTETSHQFGVQIAATSESTPPLPSVAPVAPVAPAAQSTQTPPLVAMQVKGQTRKTCVGAEAPRRRGRNQASLPPAVPVLQARPATGKTDIVLERETVSVFPAASCPDSVPSTYVIKGMSNEQSSVPPAAEAPRRRGRHHNSLPPAVPVLQAPPANGKTAMIVQRETVSSLPSSSCQDSVPSSSPVKSMSNEQSSVPPSAPVLPASSETVKMDLGSEVRPISSNPMIPAPDTSPATSIITGLSGSVLNTEVGAAPSSQPNPPFTYDTLGSQSINPSPPVPKQPKGRGRKPQSGVEAPQRRGRKRGPVAPIGADGLASGDPKSNEPHQSTAQVLPGRKSIGTSRKKVNETMEPPNVDHVQASEVQKFEGLAGLEAKPSGQPDYLAQNKHQKAFSTTSDSSDIPLDKSCSQKMDAKAQEMKGPVLEEPIVSESVAAESKSMEKKKNSMLETAAAVVDQEIQMTKTDVSVKTRETNDPKLQETVVSKPAVCELETKLDAGSSMTVEDSRDVVEEKPSVKINMEGTSAVPPSAELLVDGTCEPDASVFETEASVLDLKVDTCEDQPVQEQQKEQQMKGPRQDDVVVSEPGETSSLEEKADAEAQGPIFQEDVVSKAEAFESETKINAGGFENVADPKDLVKENLMETSVEGSSVFSLNTDSSDDVPYERLHASDASVLETAASVLAITVDKGGDQSQKEDGKEQDIKCPVQDEAIVSEPGESQSLEEKTVSTTSNLEPAASVVDTEIKKTQKEVDAEALESTDPILQEADVSKPEACEPETSPNASGENLADIRELVIENSMVEVNLEEGTSAITLNADASDNVHCEEPPAPAPSVLEAAASVLDLSMDYEDQSGKEDAKEQQMSGPVPDDIVVTEPEETTRLEGKEFLTSATLEKEAPAFDAETEKIEKDVDATAQESNDPILQSCGSETEISAGSSENLADPRDLFRENLTGGTIVGGTSVVSLNVDDPLAGVLSEKPPAPEVAPLELAMDKGEDHGKEDATEQKMEDALVDEAVVAETKSLEESTSSVLEKAALVVDPETEKTEPKVDEEAQEGDDLIFQEAVVSEPEFCEPETELEAGSSEKVADPRDVDEENSDPPENVPLEKSPTPDALVLETAAPNLEFTMDKCEVQSGKEDTKEQEMEDTLLEKGLVPEPLVTENLSSEEGETVPTFVDPPHVKPDTQLNAGSSENAADSEQEKKGTVLDKGLVSEPSVTENQSLEEGEVVSPIVDPPHEKPNIQLHTGSSENVTDLEEQERKGTVSTEGLVSEPAVTENQSSEEGEAVPLIIDPPNEMPDTQLNAGSSENVADLEEQERKGTAPDKGFVSEPAVTENQSSERETVCPIADPPHKKPETQINAGPCENAGDSEHVVEERNDTILDMGLVSEFAATENQSSEDRETLVSASSSENMGDSEHVLKETLVMETNEVIPESNEVIPEVPLDPIPNDDVAHVEPLDLDASLNGSSLGDSSIEMNSALASEGAKESSSALDDKSAQAE